MSEYLVTIGTFDGVHKGHQKLLAWVKGKARRWGLKTRVVFFEFPPRFYFRPEQALPILTTSSERRSFIRDLGIDRVDILRFGPRWAKMAHSLFFRNHLIRRWKAGGVLVGKDFAFGAGRLGDLAYLKRECGLRGMRMGVLPLVRVGGRKISSSDIRTLLLKGRVREAARLLGRNYAVSGRVVRGKGLGRTLGFPTANLKLPEGLLAPPGVFEVLVRGDGLRRRALCNVGTTPTLDGANGRLKVEIHIPGWKGGLYGRKLAVEFMRRLRAERRFSSAAALKRAIERDILSLARDPLRKTLR